ncbi:hypothetical protein [Lysobacter sp. Root494]|uniref:hypothetical protein n=1 Tax=Lysobacter sp. Root494 TaxID=1736549 RepID=UPI0006F5D3C3|nr:hypothetical protein [Lysobacter sp. Root494]KQY49813.1 hypothetical protein ASD14_13920 [Lysobacter sp. Root494]
MNIKILPVLLVAITLAACGGQSDAPNSNADTQTPKEQPAKPASRTRLHILPIAGGIHVPETLIIRSRSSKQAADGTTDRVVRAEYARIDEAQAEIVLANAFEAAGFKPLSTAETSNTHVVRNADGLRVRYVITPQGPDLKVALQAPDAQGLVSFYWKQAAK